MQKPAHRDLKVLILTSIFPNREEPTRGIYILNQAKALSRHCRVRVVAPIPYFPRWLSSRSYGLYAKVPREEVIKDIPISHPRIAVVPKIGLLVNGVLYFLSLLKCAVKLKTAFKPDILISYWVYPDGFGCALLGKALGLPLILGGLGCDINNANSSPLLKRMVSWTLRNSDRVMAISKAMKAKMEGLGVADNKIAVIPNGLAERFAPMAKAEARKLMGFHFNDHSTPMIVYCGRFSPEKGLEYLVKAARILDERMITFRLLMVGEGPAKERIRQLVRELGLQNTVLFIPELPSEIIPIVMNSADVFCLPSIREGWPNVLTEALGCGIPAVASQVGGIPEILTSPDYGMMVPPENPDALAEALATALGKSWDAATIAESVRHRTWHTVATEVLDQVELAIAHE
jgi:teichuronic acid biosynthesis glycosyltransferase TuaC